MLFTSIYNLSKYYTQHINDMDTNDVNKANDVNTPHYFYEKPLVLLISCSVIYFILMI